MEIALRPITSKEPLQPPVTPGELYRQRFAENHSDPEKLKRVYTLGQEANRRTDLKKLTPKQRRFVFELLSDPSRNRAQAALRAGYAYSTAMINSNLIANHPQVAAAIAEEDRRVYAKFDITQEKILQHIASIAFANILDYVTTTPNGEVQVDLQKLKRLQGRPIQEVKVDVDAETGKQKISVKLADKLGALTLLGKRYKLFEEPQQNTTINIQFLDRLVAGNASMAELDLSKLSGPVIEGSVSASGEVRA